MKMKFIYFFLSIDKTNHQQYLAISNNRIDFEMKNNHFQYQMSSSSSSSIDYSYNQNVSIKKFDHHHHHHHQRFIA
ncbi:hypothetical protein DERF_009998 [Dermatophagoides farinae]|uniref:Uncharacterized protein n=1 Tax=Dermatophagoides farinae TaxID=6954 RepID=A0A922I0B7_DERFA|nr:hypothetical protein DERF_009998 [Dermatophagoides farinae]